MSEDAKVLFPGKEVTLTTGEKITVEPFTFIEVMTSAAKYARSFAGALKAASETGELQVLDVIAEGGEDVLKLVKLAVKKPHDWWVTVLPDDGLALTTAVLQVNKDFFTERLQGPLEALMKAIGEPSSPVSSEPVTTGETSSTTP